MKTLKNLKNTNELKKINLFILAFLLLISSDLFSKKYKISVSQVIQHKALDQTRKGIYDELKSRGFVDGENIEWVYENAQGNPVLAGQIAQKFVGKESDVIVTLGTSVTQAAIAQSKGTIPIIFGSVTDPKAAGIIDSTKNVTGVSNYIPSIKQFEFFKKLTPNLKTIGVVYNPGEPNSRVLIDEMKKSSKELGLKIKFAPAMKTVDVYNATLSLKDKVECVFVNNDNTVLSAFKSVVEAAKAMEVPAYVSDIDIVSLGAKAALGPNQYDLGKQVAKMIIKHLGGTEIKKINIEYPKKIEKVLGK